ncbi:glycine-rich RNA-binding protein 4, mitochondrial-like [Senna tora]|uniref:Glycine-rich RNA-binding protein 4, mitochondrial-like n=1 Tax=Senna tora TaxID=362788 RepID=A0A834SFQ3_9FABA|nr:glycine-rich RNA-binding protein 4, mitochondrial-like [Senna tora]
MAFINKIGKLLKQSAVKHINLEFSASTPSIYQAIRSMSSARVFVGGVSYSTDEMSLREAFARYGEVIDARIIMDRETGRSRGFGFVTFTSTEEASSAIQALDGQDLHGRRIRVNFATERARPGFGGGGGGFYGGGGGGGGSGGYARSNYGGDDSYRSPSYGSSGGGFRSGGNYGAPEGAGGGNYQFNENSGGDQGFASSELSSNSALGDDEGQFGSNQNEETGIDNEDSFKDNNDEDDLKETRQ